MNQSTSKGSIGLDQSNHNLNNSSSKQKFSFPKANRFEYSKSGCDSFYQIPSTKSRRGTSFGYGSKDMGIRSSRYAAQPASYSIGRQFEGKNRGTSFGPGREEMQLGGPMKNSILKKYIPGPGKYQTISTLQNGNITFKPRLPDKSQKHLLKNPGPGTYQYEQIGKEKYYITSKHPNTTNYAKISPPHMDKPQNRTISIGPGQCKKFVTADKVDQEEMKGDGKYVLSKNKSSKSRCFTKSPRESIVYKHLLSTPGPGNYTPFTYFGPA